jgi:hypothetical protein
MRACSSLLALLALLMDPCKLRSKFDFRKILGMPATLSNNFDCGLPAIGFFRSKLGIKKAKLCDAAQIHLA